MLSFPVPVLSFLFVSFRPSSLRFPQLFRECFPCAFAFGLFRFPFGSFRPLPFRLRLLGLCFFLSVFFPFPPHSGFPGATFSALASSVFPVLPSLVSHAFFPGFRTRLSVRFLSSFPVSLPQPFHRCFPSFPLPFVRFFSGLFPSDSLSFVRLSSVLTTQPSALSFPFFPISPGSGSFGALRFLASPLFSSSVSPVSMRPFRFRYSASCVSFLRFTVSCHRHYAATGLLFPARPSPWLSL